MTKRPDFKKEKRILAFVDTSATGFAIGYFIEFHIRLLCEAHINKVNKIDFAFVYNPEKPVSHWTVVSWVTRDNFHLHLAEVFPLLNINQKEI